MPRLARLIVLEYPHHVTQRGNYRQDVFLDDSDRRRYLMLLADYSKKFRLTILSYCLMNNHVHFIVIHYDKNSIANTFHILHTRYSQYFNKKMKVAGHLWQGRYYSCVLDEQHLLVAVKYVERNPIRAKIVKKPYDYIWSSAKNHTGESNNDIIDARDLFKYIEIEQSKWKDFIDRSDEPDDVSAIRKYTITGRPLGNIAFVQNLEKAFGERLHALPVGRPKKIGDGK